jgi:beta-lactamase superfamily II metal-dependent hydrolase
MTENYSLEIDFLPVGDGSRSGDAIALRFGICKNEKWENPTIMIIDGGNSDSGERLVKHVKEVYNATKVDRLILTHPDADHASGLRNVIEQLEIGKIWMHCPWNHWADLQHSIKDNRITKKSFTNRLREAYQFAHDIEQLAIEKKIEIFSPHQGRCYHLKEEKLLTILGPSKDLYLKLVQSSDKTPAMAVTESKANTFSSTEKKLAFEDMTFETEHLAEDKIATSAENNMSLVMLLTIGGAKVLFTGDAGTEGLFNAITYANSQGINLKDLHVLDVPHHGSRHNLSKGILKHIKAKIAIISCAKNGEPSHPSKIVTNSLIRRGITPYWTQGQLLYYHKGFVINRGYNSAIPIPFSNQVEIPINE